LGPNNENGVTAQAYADGILLFANSFDNMHTLFDVVADFICESNVQLNPKKCQLLKIGNDNYTEFIIKYKKTG
jgi:hypothetical protein